MGKFWSFNKHIPETQRKLVANDSEFNSSFKYVGNEIKTSHYTWYNFLFINLFEQFHRIVNIYFIVLLVLTFIDVISSYNPVTTLIPIVIVLTITAVKDAYDDVHRHRSDKEINNRECLIVSNNKLEKSTWDNIKVGDILKLTNNQHVPADLLLLSSSEEHNLVYIETAELDGETNLKVRQAFPQTGRIEDNLELISQFKGKLICEAPNNYLHKFTGNLEVKDEKLPVDVEKILLRGCTLRNTSWCFGLVVFAGSDTKLMQNAGRRTMKRTRIERFMNFLVWWIFLLLFVLSALAGILNSVWETNVGDLFQLYLPWDPAAPNPQMSGFLMFWSNLIILNTLVPISLYVSVEFIRLGQSFFINWDRLMFYEKKNLPAVARTTTLNEELGQVQYIFSDKTGTLTQNVMKFNKCSIAGKRYGKVDQTESQTVDLSFNKFADKSFQFYDQHLIDKIRKKDEKCLQFFRLLTICHTAMVEENKDGGITYRAQSPDEDALVSAAKNFGLVFHSRTFDTISVMELGDLLEYKVLAVLDFDNIRKRMSVIVEEPSGKIMLYCKGADSVVIQRLSTLNDQQLVAKTEKHITSFSKTGLRTLCLAMKEVKKEDFEIWLETYKRARTQLQDREDSLRACYEEIERDLTLLGATAIEDKLQDGVPETIANLSRANIKIWVLTGDKQETAVNIGYSCNMLTEDMKNVFVVNKHEFEDIETQLTAALDEIQGFKGGIVNDAYINDTDHHLVKNKVNQANNEETFADKYGLVINGHSLVCALGDELKLKFLELASMCSAVICCRVTPLQKAMVVELVKKNKKVVTLAIGDGANDVSMIKAAHIGVGISGEEGTQAVLSSDFAFGQFRYLERLLFVHGRWSYMRMCKFLSYFFYKNFAFTLMQFWFGFYNGFSAQSVYDDWFVTMYNIVYTSTPILVIGILDQDLSDQFCIRFPKLYLPGQKNEYFNMKVFSMCLLQGIYTSLIMFFFPFEALHETMSSTGLDMNDHQSYATVISVALLFVVTLQVALDTSYWTALNQLFVWGSIAMFFPFTLILNSDGLYNLITSQFPFYGSSRTVFSYPVLWLNLFLTNAVCLLPVIMFRFIKVTLWPSYTETILRNKSSLSKLNFKVSKSNQQSATTL